MSLIHLGDRAKTESAGNPGFISPHPGDVIATLLEPGYDALVEPKAAEEFFARVEAAGYSTEVAQNYFIQEYGPAWAWSSGTLGRVEAMRTYWVLHHPGEPLPTALEPGYTGKAPEPEKIGGWALLGVLALALLAVAGRGTNRRSEAA